MRCGGCGWGVLRGVLPTADSEYHSSSKFSLYSFLFLFFFMCISTRFCICDVRKRGCGGQSVRDSFPRNQQQNGESFNSKCSSLLSLTLALCVSFDLS